MHRSFGQPSPSTDEPATVPDEFVTEFCDADFGSHIALNGDADAPARRSRPLSVDLWTLVRFKVLMAAEGWPVKTARMIFDRVYAHERLAFGHTSANEELRALSLDIFRRIHADDGLQH
jgi:hypothetical protein